MFSACVSHSTASALRLLLGVPAGCRSLKLSSPWHSKAHRFQDRLEGLIWRWPRSDPSVRLIRRPGRGNKVRLATFL
eukprot:1152902-Pyramimonas_sp.AAC.1